MIRHLLLVTLLAASTLLSGCIVDPGYGWGGGHEHSERGHDGWGGHHGGHGDD